ncbi:uncharacterized protein LY89DRAFT_735714 [Mollisia scopiformis]|uniref:Uncharacterized protein n=1 Tax=Mollisia scopiformis TaxID=149040 RepID=A0A194X485_MOLSC|nr:uncharacterized protein LY89DRAFT_735714 [Mollisia scopiformis]KUJ14637.1 hypothetical protein LY89DRAFT_735714 [Mollisia scopiformis]
MWKNVGLRAFEVWLISRLLSSPSFHRVVRKVHRRVHEVRRGEKLYDPEDFSGLHIDKPNDFKIKKFLNHYREELKDQFRSLVKK